MIATLRVDPCQLFDQSVALEVDVIKLEANGSRQSQKPAGIRRR